MWTEEDNTTFLFKYQERINEELDRINPILPNKQEIFAAFRVWQ